jgi:predicted phosphoribosyltransferase
MIESGNLLKNREEAGKLLAYQLLQFKWANPLVVAIPRGGVPVGYEIAKALGAPLDTIIVRKIGAPGNPEFAIGAMTSSDTEINSEMVRALGISKDQVEEITKREKKELDRRIKTYGSGSYSAGGSFDVVILVDDGFATGLTVRAAIKALKLSIHPIELVVAVPVCAFETSIELQKLADKFVCLMEPLNLVAISLWYEDFPQLSDKNVCEYLEESSNKTYRL